MKAFLTGSRVYGRVEKDSDIDLVVIVDEQTYYQLKRLSDSDKSIRFGRLNLIACTTELQLAVWKVGTERIVQVGKANKVRKPIGKKRAKKILDFFRNKVGIKDMGLSEE